MRTLIITFASLCAMLIAATASAQPQGEGIAFGWEEEIVHVADLDPEQREFFRAQTELDLAVGFAYRRAYLFSGPFSFWHWRGRYVLFHGGNILEPPPGELQKLLGDARFATLRPPLAYRVPLGLATVVSLTIAGCAAIYLTPTKEKRVRRRLQDPNYAAALEVYSAALGGPEDDTSGPARKLALSAAIEFLTAERGVPGDTADKNLREIISLQDEWRSKQLRQLALHHELAGEWNEALDLYEEAAELRELWDPKDYAFLQKCIQRVEQKQAADDESS